MEKSNQVPPPINDRSGFMNVPNPTGLPLPRQKNLLNLAFLIGMLKDFEYPLNPGMCFEYNENQSNTRILFYAFQRFLRFGQVSMFFEFNKPILKKGPRILKDFEKNSTDFEGFAMDFERILNDRSYSNGLSNKISEMNLHCITLLNPIIKPGMANFSFVKMHKIHIFLVPLANLAAKLLSLPSVLQNRLQNILLEC